DHPRTLGADEADLLQFVERLPHADQACAAAGGIENRVRNVPAELLGEFESHRFLALDPVWLLQRRRIEPPDFRLALADDLAAVIDQPVDAIDVRALQRDLAHVYFGRVFRTEDRRLDARP